VFTFYQRAAIGYADGSAEAFSYDDRGNILTHEDQSGELWTYTYTDTGQVLTSHNPLGGLITYTYNADGTLASSTDADMGVVTYDYDAYKRRTRLTHPDGSFVQTSYDLNDRITSITDENGHAYAYVYDANGNLVQVEDPAGNVMGHTFNLMDQVTQVTDRLGFDTLIAYDSLGRLASVDDGNGDQFAFGYDPRGWRNEIARGGETWQMTYTDEGQLASFTAPSGNSSTYPRNALGYETAVTDAMSRTAVLTRDERSRVTGVTDLLGRTTSFGYDRRGWLTEVSVAGIGAVEYFRNGLGQVEQLVDQNGETWSFEYSGMGRLQTQTDPLSNTWQYEYDNRGRLHRTTFPDGRTMTRTHDAVGNTLRRHYSDGTYLHFQYDENNRLIATDGISLTRDAEGRVIETENSGAAFEATYGDASRLLSVTYDQGTGQEAFTVTYTYNLTTGLLTKVSDNLTGAWVTFAYDRDRKLIAMQRSNGITTTLGRDDVGRITRIQHGAFSDLRYKLDAAGQVTQTEMTAPLDPKTLLGGGTEVQTYDAASQISSSGYSYDQRGRLTAAPDHVFTWDDASRLIGVDDVTLTYNGLDDLFTRTENGATVHFYYNHAIRLQPIVAEREEGSGQFLRYYVWTPDGELLYVIDPLASDEVAFYHFDRTGSTLALTDEAGSVTDAYAYGPYGALLGRTGGSPQPFTFNGKWGVRQEGERGDLYQMRARVYDAQTSRFISRDPVWPALGNPFQVNPYQFAKANPVQWNDVTGLIELIIPDGNGGGTGAISGIHYDDYIAGMSSEMAYVNSVEENSNEAELVELWSTLGQFNDFTVVQDSALMWASGDMSDATTIFASTQVEDGVSQDIIFGFSFRPGETVTDDQMQNLIENWQSVPDLWGNNWSPEDSEDQFGDNEWGSKWW
jgi:RHS repeat-associated protein